MSEIVIGVDGSAGAARALDWALAEAAVRQADLRVVYVFDVAHIPAGTPIPSTAEQRAAATALLDDIVDAALHRVGGASPPRIIREIIAVGARNPAASLIASARKADLLVVGSRGLGGFTGLVAGSVSDQCAQHAPCPVAVVPSPHDD